MKKTVILTLAILVLLPAGAAAADPNAKKITIDNTVVRQIDDTVVVDFDMTVGKRVAGGRHTVIYRPYLVNEDYRWDMPEVVIRKKSGTISEQRREWRTGEAVAFDNPAFLGGGEQFHYSAELPRQGWMKGADLCAEIIYMGCCEIETRGTDILAAGIDLPTPMGIVPVWVADNTPVEPERAPTTGDIIAEEMPFVLAASEFESTMPQLMFDDDREEALRVHFAVNSAVLEQNRANNAETLELLLEAIRRIEEAPDSHVEHVVVAGFASPEGSFALNDRLAWNRAAILNKYIVDHSTLDDDVVHIYNGVEDWFGLRMLVEASDMADKQAVIDIIDSVPIADAQGRPVRELELKKLDGGRTYNYMLRNFFPELRAAAYIKVYYGND